MREQYAILEEYYECINHARSKEWNGLPGGCCIWTVEKLRYLQSWRMILKRLKNGRAFRISLAATIRVICSFNMITV